MSGRYSKGSNIVRLATLPVDERLAGPNIAVEAVSDRRVVALGDSARVVVTVYNRSAMQISARPGWPGAPAGSMVAILPDSSYGWTTYLRGTEITQPWWLATPRIRGSLFCPNRPPFGGRAGENALAERCDVRERRKLRDPQDAHRVSLRRSGAR